MIYKSKKFRIVLIIFFSALIGLMFVPLCGGKTNLSSIIVLYAVLKISNTGGIRTTSNLILAGIITASTCQAATG